MLIPILVISLLTIFMIANQKAFYGFLLFLLFGIMTFAPRAIREYPFTYTGKVTFFEIILISLVIAWVLGKYCKSAKFLSMPTSRWLFILFILIIIADFRGFLYAGTMSAKWDYLRSFPIIFIMPMILTTEDYHKRIMQVYAILCLSVLTISLITIVVNLGYFNVPGLKYDIYQRTLRVVWGGMGPVVPFTVVMILVTLRYFPNRWKFVLISIGVLGIVAIFLSQSRQLFFLGMLLFVFWCIISRSIANWEKIALSIGASLIVILVVWKLPNTVFESFLYRLSLVHTEIKVMESILSGEITYNTFGRFSPFVYALQSTSDFLEVLFGKGATVTDPYVGGPHFHSGWGYIYLSMGLIGIVVVLVVLFKMFITYQGFIKKTRTTGLDIDLITLINMYFVSIIIIGIIVGFVLQGYSIAFNGLLLGTMELARRKSMLPKE